MHVILTVLAVLGKILLTVFLIAMILIAALLFTPFLYLGRIRKTEETFAASAALHWLLIALVAVVKYEDGRIEWKAYLFGVPLHRIIPWIMERRKKKGEGDAGSLPAVRASVDNEKAPEPKRSVRGRIRNIADKIKTGVELMRSDAFQGTRKMLKKEVPPILKQIRPVLSGLIRFGFDDPSATGMALGALSAVYPSMPKKLCVEPDFTEKRLEADVKFHGAFFLIVLLIHGLKIAMNKKLRKLIRKVKKMSRKTPVIV